MTFHNLDGTTINVADDPRKIDEAIQVFLGKFQTTYKDTPVLFIHKKTKDCRPWVLGIPDELISLKIDKSNAYLVGEIVLNKNCCAKSYAEFVTRGNWKLADATEIKNHERSLDAALHNHNLLKDRNDPAVANDRLIKALADERAANAQNTDRLMKVLEGLAVKTGPVADKAAKT